MPKIAVVYYSATGHVHQLAEAVAAGAADAGAEVRLRRVREIAPPEMIRAVPAWQEHQAATRETVEEATNADLAWADGFAFGTPARFGSPAAALKQFLEATGPLAMTGGLTDKPVTSFVSSNSQHGGQEAAILALGNSFYHWGSILVPPGYTDPSVLEAGGNPYGTSWASGGKAGPVGEAALRAAQHQGRRLARLTAVLVGAAEPA